MSRQQHPFAIAQEVEAIEIFRQGELAERKRIRAIVESPEAFGREGAAQHLALCGLPARTAIAILGYTPRAEAPAYNVRPARWPAVTFSIVGVSKNEP